MNANYAIDDGNGDRLTAGLQEWNARKVAQEMANEMGETVYLYETGEGEADAEQEAFEPQVSVEITARAKSSEQEERALPRTAGNRYA